jgi:hypothetical protein
MVSTDHLIEDPRRQSFARTAQFLAELRHVEDVRGPPWLPLFTPLRILDTPIDKRDKAAEGEPKTPQHTAEQN